MQPLHRGCAAACIVPWAALTSKLQAGNSSTTGMVSSCAGELIVEATDQTHRHPLQHAVIAAVDAAARRDLQLWPAQQASALPGHAEGQAQQAAALAGASPVQPKAAAALDSDLQAQARAAEQHSLSAESTSSKRLAADATAELPGGA